MRKRVVVFVLLASACNLKDFFEDPRCIYNPLHPALYPPKAVAGPLAAVFGAAQSAATAGMPASEMPPSGVPASTSSGIQSTAIGRA